MLVIALCFFSIVVIYAPAIWLIFSSSNPNRTYFGVENITASSQHDTYDPNGLFLGKEPGWHSAFPAKYPQEIIIEFVTFTEIRYVGLLQQNGQTQRAPKAYQIEVSTDGILWMPISRSDDACALYASSGWTNIMLPKAARGRFIKVVIFSNCGDPQWLTLKGLRIW